MVQDSPLLYGAQKSFFLKSDAAAAMYEQGIAMTKATGDARGVVGHRFCAVNVCESESCLFERGGSNKLLMFVNHMTKNSCNVFCIFGSQISHQHVPGEPG